MQDGYRQMRTDKTCCLALSGQNRLRLLDIRQISEAFRTYGCEGENQPVRKPGQYWQCVLTIFCKKGNLCLPKLCAQLTASQRMVRLWQRGKMMVSWFSYPESSPIPRGACHQGTSVRGPLHDMSCRTRVRKADVSNNCPRSCRGVTLEWFAP